MKNYNTAFYYEEAGHPNYAFGINRNKVYGGDETYVYHWELNYSGVSANGPYGTWSYTIPSSVALQDLITTSSVWNEVSSKLDTSSFSDVSSTFLTAHQDISNLMPKSESANFYPMTGNPSGFINELPDEEEVEFEEINLSSFATSSQINELSGAIDYVSANAGGTDWTDEISSLSGQINEISGTLSGKHTLSAGEGISFYEDNENNITRIDCTATGGGTSYTGDAQGALDKVYTNSGKWLTGDFSGAGQPILFTDKNSVILSSKNTSIKDGSFNFNWSGDYGTSIDISLSRYGVSSNYIYMESPWEKWGLNTTSVYGNSWILNAKGVTGSEFIGGVSKPWSALRNVDLGLTTGSTVSSISGHSLAVGDVSNIVLTSTLPATPDSNTLYLIPEV